MPKSVNIVLTQLNLILLKSCAVLMFEQGINQQQSPEMVEDLYFCLMAEIEDFRV